MKTTLITKVNNLVVQGSFELGDHSVLSTNLIDDKPAFFVREIGDHSWRLVPASKLAPSIRDRIYAKAIMLFIHESEQQQRLTARLFCEADRKALKKFIKLGDLQ